MVTHHLAHRAVGAVLQHAVPGPQLYKVSQHPDNNILHSSSIFLFITHENRRTQRHHDKFYINLSMIVATVTTDLYAVQGLMSMVAAPRAGMSFLTLDMGVEQFSEASCVT